MAPSAEIALHNGTASDRANRRIFVQIPAYRDPELSPTLHDLFSKARNPEALRVAVLWQRAPDDRVEREVLRRKNLEIIDVSYRDSKGCNWARNVLQRLWKGEAYTLILDSHHRFAKNWDQKLIESHDALVQQGIERPILTAYLPPYNPLTEPHGRKNKPLKIYPFARSNGLLLRLIGRPILNWSTLSAPVAGDFVSLHCLFASGEFNRDVQFDPNCYFFGDEVSTSLRAFTHGYDVFHPHRVIGWHCYERAYRSTHWDDHDNWSGLEMSSMKRLRTLLSGRPMNLYGRGDRRSLREFEDKLLVKLCEEA